MKRKNKEKKNVELFPVDIHLSAEEILKQKEYLELKQELLVEKDLKSSYQTYLEERASMLPLNKEERERVEAVIKNQILQIFKKNKEWAQGEDEDKGFFKYAHFRAIPEVREYFQILAAIGDRNMGKSTSAKEEVDGVVKLGRKFMWLRNIDDEVEGQLNSDVGEKGWLTDRGWSYEGNKKSPTIVSPNGAELGWYRPVNTSSKLKSIEFPDTDLIVYEEFPEGNVKNKYYKFVKLVSTILRFNPNGWAIMQANYVDQQDDMLQKLGVGSKTRKVEDFVHFNWEVGAMIIFIPQGIYRQPKDKKNDRARRLSLGDYDTWKSQYGGGFDNEEPNNIIDMKQISHLEPIFNIYTGDASSRADVRKYGAFKLTLYHVYDNEGNIHNVLSKTFEPNDKPVFIFEALNKVLYPHAMMMEYEALDNLLHEWNTGNLKTNTLAAHERISYIFANAVKILSRDEEYITEIEEITQ